MNTEHLLPSTRITAARYAGMATKDIARRAGLNEITAHWLACRAACLAPRFSPETAINVIDARIKSMETRHA